MAATLAEFLIDRADSAVVSIDDQGIVTAWNPSAESIFGILRSEALGRPVAELIIPERSREEHFEGLRRFLETGEARVLNRPLELTAIRADGTEIPVALTVSPFHDGDRWSFHAFVSDLSDRKRAEQERERLVEELHLALRGSERRFDAIVGSMGDAVTIRDREHRFVYANPAAVAHLGFASWEELRDTHPDTIMADFWVFAEDGREIRMEDIPSVRILRGEPAEPLLIRTIERRTGRQRWNLLKAAPLLGEQGQVEATITIIEDVTTQKRAELQAAFLAQASALLASSLDYQQTLRNLAELAVPDLVDWCAVDLIDDDGDRQSVAVAHVDPARVELAEELRHYEAREAGPDRGLGLLLRTGEPIFHAEVPDALLEEVAIDDRHLELLRAVGVHSALAVPIRLGQRILGALTLVSSQSGRRLDELDQALAEQVAARAAMAIENARLYSRRSSIARTLQMSLLPEQLPEIPGYELASVYLPAMEGSLVGGDFYDVWRARDGWLLIIGDVAGKGVEAAALTALVRHTMRTASEFLTSPAELLARVDATLKQRPALSVCTALCLRLADGGATLAVAGHPLPLIVRGDRIATAGAHGPLLGAFADVAWADTRVELEPGGTFVAYTDGITDAINGAGGRFGIERLRGALRGGADRSAAAVIEAVGDALAEFQTRTHADDTAAIALHRLPTVTVEGNPSGTRSSTEHASGGAAD
jgi:PAS domain S-box-containing protein